MTNHHNDIAAHMAMTEDEITLLLADKIGFGDGDELQTVNRGDLVSIIRAVEAAGRVQQAEPVAWQYRWLNPGDNQSASPSELEWKPLAPRWTEPMTERVAEMLAYKHLGKSCYEVRALAVAATAARAPAPTVAEAHADNAPLGFTDHEKSAWSIGVEHGMRLVARTAQEASKPVQAEAHKAKTADEMRPDFEWWWTSRSIFPALGTREAAAAWAAWVASGGYTAPSDWRLSDAPWGWAEVISAPTARPAAPAVQAGDRNRIVNALMDKGCPRIDAENIADDVLAALASPPAGGETDAVPLDGAFWHWFCYVCPPEIADKVRQRWLASAEYRTALTSPGEGGA